MSGRRRVGQDLGQPERAAPQGGHEELGRVLNGSRGAGHHSVVDQGPGQVPDRLLARPHRRHHPPRPARDQEAGLERGDEPGPHQRRFSAPRRPHHR